MTKDIGVQRRMDLANDLTLMGLASILPHGGEEAHDQFTETLESLRAEPDDPSYRTDPNAAPDLDALAASGIPIQKVRKADANDQQGEDQ